MFGCSLEGFARVRFVYVDEAGTSAHEPVVVVAAIIAHADTHCEAVEARIAKVMEKVPQPFRDKYPIFHAKTIWGSRDFRDEWDLTARKALLQEVMSIPREMKLAVAFGAERKDDPVPPEIASAPRAMVSHGIAFQTCIALADGWIREFAAPDEVGTVIAEDVPAYKTSLRFLAEGLKAGGFVSPGTARRHGANTGSALEGVYKITRIRLPIHFVAKQDEPLLQIADACAFGFKRYLCEYSHGSDFVSAILGPEKSIDKDARGGKGGLFFWSHPGPLKPGPGLTVVYRYGALAGTIFLKLS
jgi:Protein of unknown function (DUF3800)